MLASLTAVSSLGSVLARDKRLLTVSQVSMDNALLGGFIK